MFQTYSQNQLPMDGAVLETRGWVSFTLSVSTESDLCQQLLAVAAHLGKPVSSRSGGGVCDSLTPTAAQRRNRVP